MGYGHEPVNLTNSEKKHSNPDGWPSGLTTLTLAAAAALVTAEVVRSINSGKAQPQEDDEFANLRVPMTAKTKPREIATTVDPANPVAIVQGIYKKAGEGLALYGAVMVGLVMAVHYLFKKWGDFEDGGSSRNS